MVGVDHLFYMNIVDQVPDMYESFLIMLSRLLLNKSDSKQGLLAVNRLPQVFSSYSHLN